MINDRPRNWTEATEVLRKALPNYEERPQQTRLAEAIEEAFESGRALVGQAGTGTGKSLAGLIPMILSGRKAVYTTGTKALQAQVIDKDLPFLAEHLGVRFTYAMLQGRSNYVCHSQLVANADQPETVPIREAIAADDRDHPEAYEITVRDSLPFEVDDRTWSKVSISSDNCTRKECPFFQRGCRAQYAKALAEEAQIVVVNHAMLATDAKLHADTAGEVSMLGSPDLVVVDEAHELEQYIVNALEGKMSMGTFRALAGYLRGAGRVLDVEVESDLDPLLEEMVATAADLFDSLPNEGRIRHAAIIAMTDSKVIPLTEALGRVAEIFDDIVADMLEDRRQTATLYQSRRRVGNLRQRLSDLVLKRDSEVVRYTKQERDLTTLFITPIEVGTWAAENLWTRFTPVLMSATILVDGDASFIARALGIESPTVVDVGSPFDFKRNSRLYVPAHMVAPAGRDRDRWAREMYQEMAQMINASQGRALLLFTSKSQMRDAFFTLRKMIDFPCKMQGDESNPSLVRWLKMSGGVLFGTKSFFTGIDIQGDALSLVIIDKLPFPVPTEPVFEAKTEMIERKGGNSFSELTIPEMTLPLMQAFGRLIRTMSDRGVVAIMDSRITGKGYGKKISRSIPAPLTTDLYEVERFFEAVG